MARGRRAITELSAADPAQAALRDALRRTQSAIDARIIAHVADTLALEPDGLVHAISQMHVDVDEDPDVWYDAARTAALLDDPAIAEACLAQLQRICRRYHTTGRSLIEGADDAPFGHEALWDRGAEGSTLWVRMATQWGHQGLTLGEVRAELQALDDDARALTIESLRAGRDIDAERLAISDIDLRRRVRDQVNEALVAHLQAGRVDEVMALAVTFHEAFDEQVEAQHIAEGTEVREVLTRLSAASAHDDALLSYSVIDEIGTMSLASLDRHLAPRSVGPRGDAALGALEPEELGWGESAGLALASWERAAARLLAAPGLVMGPDDLSAHALALHAEDLDAWRTRYEAHPAFGGWYAGVYHDGWNASADLYLLGELAGEVDGAPQCVVVAVPLGFADDDDTPRRLTRAIIDGLESRGVAAPDLPRELPVAQIGGGRYPTVLTPPYRASVPCDALVTPPICLHTYATWQRNRPNDALVLCCDSCGARALAVVPLHRAPGERITDERAYLARESFYAALEGREAPTSLAALRAREPMASLDLAEYLPHLAPATGAAEDLGAALFG